MEKILVIIWKQCAQKQKPQGLAVKPEWSLWTLWTVLQSYAI